MPVAVLECQDTNTDTSLSVSSQDMRKKGLKKKKFSSTIHSNPERGIVKEPWEHTEGDSARRC